MKKYVFRYNGSKSYATRANSLAQALQNVRFAVMYRGRADVLLENGRWESCWV